MGREEGSEGTLEAEDGRLFGHFADVCSVGAGSADGGHGALAGV